MIKLVRSCLRSFIVSDTDSNNEAANNGEPAREPDVDIGQRAEGIVKSRCQQSADSEFDVGCWR